MRPRLGSPCLRQLVQAADQALEVGAAETIEGQERLNEPPEAFLGLLVVVTAPALRDVQCGRVRQ
jgi:hypothetical protein